MPTWNDQHRNQPPRWPWIPVLLSFGLTAIHCSGPGPSPEPDGGTDAVVLDADLDARRDGGGVDAAPPRWTQVGQPGGFVSSVLITPQGTYLSGDDGSGLYRKTDDGWALLTTAPLNWSTYSWAQDPLDPATYYAPNHFGRGLALTRDSGASFELMETLPYREFVFDFLAIPVGDHVRLLAATSVGLFLSDDGGRHFAKAPLPTNLDVEVRALARRRSSGLIAVGTGMGGLFLSDDDGESFRTVLTPQADGVPVSDLAFTEEALYVGFDGGALFRMRDLSGQDLVQLAQGAFSLSLWTKVAAAHLPDANADRVYTGTTSGPQGPPEFLVSDDGGESFDDRSAALAGASVFDISLDPDDPDHVLVGTVDDGVFESSDAGRTFENVSSGIQATDSLAFAEDTEDPDHIIYSSHTGWPGTGRVFESLDAGRHYEQIHELDAYSVVGLQLAGRRLIAATLLSGIWRRDENGSWEQTATMTHGFGKIAASKEQPGLLFGATEERIAARPEGDDWRDAGLWVSEDDGRTWQLRVNTLAGGLAVWPGMPRAAAYGADDVYVSDDAFTTSPRPLGLGQQLGDGDLVTALVFVDQDTILAGTMMSRLFLITDCNPAGSGHIVELASPFAQAPVFGLTVSENSTGPVWVAGAWAGDMGYDHDTMAGVWASDNLGITWNKTEEGLYPTNMVFDLHRSVVPGRIYAGMWGGGLMRLDLIP